MYLHKTISIAFLFLFATVSGQQTEQKKPKAYIVSNAHLDTQWNWDVRTTINEYVRNTLEQNLFLLKRYPNYIFNFEGGVKYSWMKEYYPEKYELLKEYVREGRWHISGSSWDATDAVIPSPESAVRNILLGQTFYQDEFGVKSTDIFLPDCFGFNYTLPTIAKHCGLIGFSTQKLQWRYNSFFGNEKYPFLIGLWEGVDGSRIMMVANGHSYSAEWRDKEDLTHSGYLKDMAGKSTLNTTYHYYGTGDIGGAPTPASVRAMEESTKGTGPLEVINATSDQLYKDYLPFENHPELPVFKGEMLMDVHGTGCYTSQAALKSYNRQNELLGDASERAAVVADWFGGPEYPSSALRQAWQRFIWHQFHDDLPGTSTPEAYEYSWNDELISLKQFSGILAASVANTANSLDTRVKGIPVIIHNTISQPVSDIVEIKIALPEKPGNMTAYNESGKAVPSQLLGYQNGIATLLISASVPAVGYVVYDVRTGGASPANIIRTTDNSIENSIYRVTLDQNGDISSILDKRHNKELVEKGRTIRLALFPKNESIDWPAWEIRKNVIDEEPVSITGDVKIYTSEKGTLRSALCIEKKYGKSVFKQYIRLSEGGQKDRIDIYNEIDWQTTDALLKAEFPLNVANTKATYDMGLGTIERGNNIPSAYEVYAQYWSDLTDKDGKYGVSVMNNSKYGWDKPNDNTLRLTLLHTPSTKVAFSYQSRQDLGHHTFTYSILGHEKGYLEGQTILKAEVLNQPFKAFRTGKHSGSTGKSFSFLNINNGNVLLKALKKAEKSDEYVIRLYETAGKGIQSADITFAGNILEAVEADGVETATGQAIFEGNKLKIDINPYSIKTYKVKLQPAASPVTLPEYEPLPLKYDLKTVSYNEFRKEANFDGAGHSYAAELLPDTIFTNGIPFILGAKDDLNGLRCNGDTIRLPQNGKYNRLYFLAASTFNNNKAIFQAGRHKHEIAVPYYSGFIGQWGHTGHTEGFLKEAEIAHVGTHRHNWHGNKDLAYEFTYMFKFGIDIPKDATEFILPENSRIVLFAATLAYEKNADCIPVSELIRTSLETNQVSYDVFSTENLLAKGTITGKSGQVNDNEGPERMFDRNPHTKWCDMNYAPNFVDVDLGTIKTIHGWRVLHAGAEARPYITSEYCLQGKNTLDEEWKTIDKLVLNPENETARTLAIPENFRYVRLFITNPVRDGGNGARIFEWEVY